MRAEFKQTVFITRDANSTYVDTFNIKIILWILNIKKGNLGFNTLSLTTLKRVKLDHHR